MRRRFRLLVWFPLLAAAVGARADDRPNILWIVSDTQGQAHRSGMEHAAIAKARSRVGRTADPLTLKLWSQGKQPREGYLVTGDPGCREILIEPIGFNPPPAHLSP